MNFTRPAMRASVRWRRCRCSRARYWSARKSRDSRAFVLVRSSVALEAGENNFAPRAAALEQRVRSAQIFGFDRAEVSLGGGADATGVDQVRHFLQQASLFLHVGRLIERTREHQLSVERERLAHEQRRVDA